MLFGSVVVFLDDLELIPEKKCGSPAHMAPSRRTEWRWLKAPQGFAKINVDATISCNPERGTSVVICRDENGRYLGATVTCFEGLVDPEVLEAHACCEGFSLASDLYLRRVRVATDCMSTVSHLKESYFGPSAMITKDIQSRQRHFERAEVVHEGKESNFEAHDPAKAAASLAAGRYVWLSTTPDFIHVTDTIEF